MTYPLVINVLVSLVGGGLAGAVLAYTLQRVGQICCFPSDWESVMSPSEQHKIEFKFRLDVFNEKSVNVGLIGLALVAYREGAEICRTGLSESVEHGIPSVAFINLRAGEFHSTVLYGLFFEEESKAFEESDYMEFEGYYYPGGYKLTRKVDIEFSWQESLIPELARARRPWWRRILGG